MLPVSGQLVAFSLSSLPFMRPGALDEPILFQLVEDGIEGAVLESESAATPLLDIQGELVPMLRSPPEGGKDQSLVEMFRQALGLEFGFLR